MAGGGTHRQLRTSFRVRDPRALLRYPIDVDKAELRTLLIELPRGDRLQSFSGTSEILNALAIVPSSRTQPYDLRTCSLAAAPPRHPQRNLLRMSTARLPPPSSILSQIAS